MNITEEDLDNLRHMLGAQRHIPKKRHGYRNHFVTDAPEDLASMDRLQQVGLSERRIQELCP